MDKLERLTSAEGLDRLIAILSQIPEARHRLPLYRAIRANRMAMFEFPRQMDRPDWREIEALSLRKPTLILIGDDDGLATGPDGWPGLSRMRYWRPHKVVVHATGGDPVLSEGVVTATVALRRVVLIEAATAHAEAWKAWGLALKPSHGVFTVVPEGDALQPAPVPREAMQ